MDNSTLFFNVWRNLVINRIIFKYSRLYIKNKFKEFNDVKSLREYNEREFISTLVIKEKYKIKNVIKGIKEKKSRESMISISKGDLPEYGVLKELHLFFITPITSFEIIPQGVESINFKHKLQVSELPASVHTISNAILKKPYTDNQIPNNITSLSFHINIDPSQFYDIKLPNSIISLDIGCLKYGARKLSIAPSTFIPTSVTNLTTYYNEKYKSNLPLIPSSVTKLHLIMGSEISNNIHGDGLIPIGVKDLTLIGEEHIIDLNILSDILPESLTKLEIYNVQGYSNNHTYEIKANSIPSSVTNLKIIFSQYPLSFDNIFQSSLTSLSISSLRKEKQPPSSKLKLPLSTMKYLKIGKTVINK